MHASWNPTRNHEIMRHADGYMIYSGIPFKRAGTTFSVVDQRTIHSVCALEGIDA